MADPKGFLHVTEREQPQRRPVDIRIQDWREVYADIDRGTVERQAARCMDCGIPFCHNGCPLGNLIPEWNDLVHAHDWRSAIERLHATNNFPEFTGKLCPAPCEDACVLGINQPAVTIKLVESQIIDRAWAEGWVQPQPPTRRTSSHVAVVGSGPAGLAAAQQLTRAGHEVTVFESADRVGGLLRYGIPEFKMEKRHLDRRIAQMRAEGTQFRTGVTVGLDVSSTQLRAQHEAVLLTGGATAWRELPVAGRDLAGVHQAMEYLPEANRVAAGDIEEPAITATGKDVVVIGGGDTGADCVGTAHRQGAASVTQLEIMPRPADRRPDSQPWPTAPMVYKVSTAHEEGGQRLYSVSTVEFRSDDQGRVSSLQLVDCRRGENGFEPVAGTERELPTQLVTLAMGFVGPQQEGLLGDLGVEFDGRGNVARSSEYATNVAGVYCAGDMGRGQSLIVWAIAEGRAAAAAVDRDLGDSGDTELPAPVTPATRALS